MMNGDYCEGWKQDSEQTNKEKTKNNSIPTKEKKKKNRAKLTKLNRIERRRGVRENIRGKAKINS